MTLPAKIKIGPMIYRVETTENLTIDNDRCSGAIDLINEKIWLDNTIKSSHVLAQTLFHEVIHGLFENLGINDPEGTVDMFSFALIDLIRCNPDFVEYIQQAFNDVD